MGHGTNLVNDLVTTIKMRDNFSLMLVAKVFMQGGCYFQICKITNLKSDLMAMAISLLRHLPLGIVELLTKFIKDSILF